MQSSIRSLDNYNETSTPLCQFQISYCIKKVENVAEKVSKPVWQNTPRYSWGKVVATS